MQQYDDSLQNGELQQQVCNKLSLCCIVSRALRRDVQLLLLRHLACPCPCDLGVRVAAGLLHCL